MAKTPEILAFLHSKALKHTILLWVKKLATDLHLMLKLQMLGARSETSFVMAWCLIKCIFLLLNQISFCIRTISDRAWTYRTFIKLATRIYFSCLCVFYVAVSNFATSFKILAGIQLGAGSLWCLQSIFRKFCNKCWWNCNYYISLINGTDIWRMFSPYNALC